MPHFTFHYGYYTTTKCKDLLPVPACPIELCLNLPTSGAKVNDGASYSYQYIGDRGRRFKVARTKKACTDIAEFRLKHEQECPNISL